MSSSTPTPSAWNAQPGDVLAVTRLRGRIQIVCTGRRGPVVVGYAISVDADYEPAELVFHPTVLTFLRRPAAVLS